MPVDQSSAVSTRTTALKQMYIYRPDAFTAGARTAYFYANATPLAEVNNDGYTLVSLDPGKYTFKQNFGYWLGDVGPTAEDRYVNKELKSGKTYYMGLYSDYLSSVNYMAQGPGDVVQIDFKYGFGFIEQNKAQKDIQECRFQQQEIN